MVPGVCLKDHDFGLLGTVVFTRLLVCWGFPKDRRITGGVIVHGEHRCVGLDLAQRPRAPGLALPLAHFYPYIDPARSALLAGCIESHELRVPQGSGIAGLPGGEINCSLSLHCDEFE